jgi:hypothetical protein
MDVLRVKGAIVLAIVVAAFLAFDLYKAESQPVESTPTTSVSEVSTTPALFEPSATIQSVQTPTAYSVTP